MRNRFGSVFQRSTDGRWAAVIEVPTPRGEARRRALRYAKSQEAAETRLGELRAEFGIIPEPKKTRKERLEEARLLGSHTRQEWYRLVRANKRVCHYCGLEPLWPEHIGQDHMIPLSRGGSDAIDNVTTSCKSCNSEKGALTADEFFAIKSKAERHYAAVMAREERRVKRKTRQG